MKRFSILALVMLLAVSLLAGCTAQGEAALEVGNTSSLRLRRL
ncbi:MAG: hypothetical protein ACOX2S_02230 [bacterium]|jgi:uncharacterized lipoprotein YajG